MSILQNPEVNMQVNFRPNFKKQNTSVNKNNNLSFKALTANTVDEAEKLAMVHAKGNLPKTDENVKDLIAAIKKGDIEIKYWLKTIAEAWGLK